MTRLGYNANGWRRHPLASAAADLAALGYEGIELWCHPVHLDLLHPDLDTVRRALERSGLTLSNLHAGVKDGLDPGYEPTLMATDDADRERRIAFIFAAIDAAEALGVELVTIHSGFAAPDVAPKVERGLLLRSLERCLEHAHEHGVTIAMEPEPGFLIESVRDYVDLHEALDAHPALALNLDIGHAHWGYEDTPAIIRELAPHIRHVHVEDIADRVHRHLVPGDGAIDFAAIWSALDDIGYDGFASVELWDHDEDPHGAASRSIEALSRLRIAADA